MEMINAIGRRKSSVARVYLTEGTGKITINKKDLKDFFPSAILQYVVKQPLNLLEVAEKYDIKANLDGGGFTGQSQALRLAIARALVKVNAEDKKALKDQGFLIQRTKALIHEHGVQPDAACAGLDLVRQSQCQGQGRHKGLAAGQGTDAALRAVVVIHHAKLQPGLAPQIRGGLLSL